MALMREGSMGRDTCSSGSILMIWIVLMMLDSGTDFYEDNHGVAEAQQIHHSSFGYFEQHRASVGLFQC
jgi:hypothetical protein